MAQPLTVSIPHKLARPEATRRLQKGITTARTHFAGKLSILEETWTDDNLTFRVAVMGRKRPAPWMWPRKPFTLR